MLAPDVGTDEQIMAWILDTYNENLGNTQNGMVVGKPVPLGGSLGSKEARGRGAAIVTERLVAGGRTAAWKTAAWSIHGYGDAGRASALYLAESAEPIIAVADAGGAAGSSGLDLAELRIYREERGSVAGFATRT